MKVGKPSGWLGLCAPRYRAMGSGAGVWCQYWWCGACYVGGVRCHGGVWCVGGGDVPSSW